MLIYVTSVLKITNINDYDDQLNMLSYGRVKVKRPFYVHPMLLPYDQPSAIEFTSHCGKYLIIINL